MLIAVLIFWPNDVTAATMVVDECNESQPTIAAIQETTTPVKIEPPASPEPIDILEPEIIPEVAPEPRYGFTDDEIYLMAALLTGSKYVDGDGEYDIDYGHQDNYEQISLVLCVVMNRVRSDIYPNTVSEVIWQKNQFSPMKRWKNGLPEVSDISIQRVTEWCEAYDANSTGTQSVPDNHLYFYGDGVKNHSYFIGG